MKTLVVDDELVSRKKMHKIMESFGESTAVENGTDAIKAFKKSWEMGIPYDLITLDIAMPDMTGIQVLTKIREIEKEKNIPEEKLVKIMMVTSHSDKEIVISSMKAGCNNYIVKPFDKERVLKKMETLGFKFE
ncbi:MAG: response regulator [Desulfobacterales bacterium]|nr:response regulator [Desulfobacterales bacterium]